MVLIGTTDPRFNSRADINRTMNLTASIFIDARGGNGQRGGRGAKGEQGPRGSDGQDATDNWNATPGGNGGPGGRGGNGTPGTNGGDGGIVRIIIPRDQTHLALLVHADVSGGAAGAAGQNGEGGEGGAGGRGGGSHTYVSGQERVCHYVPDEDSSSSSGSWGGSSGGSYYDSGGGYDTWDDSSLAKPSTRNFANLAGEIGSLLLGVTAAQAGESCSYENVYSTRPSARDGYDGPNGYPGNGAVYAGRAGENGRFEFIVVESNGTETRYVQPFNLQLLSYDISDIGPGGNNDGIFEPGEQLTISNIRVKNTARMPSPEKADVLLSLQSSQWILTDPTDQVSIPALRGGQEVVLPNRLVVQVKRNGFNVGSTAWQMTDTLVPVGRVTRVQRTQSGLSLPKVVTMSFPVEISSIQTVSTVGPGEFASIQWRLTNRSNRRLQGLEGVERALSVALNANGTAVRNLKFALNESNSNTTFLRTITGLGPNESVIISGDIHFSENAEPYTAVDLQTTLGLQLLGERNLSPIMSHQHRIRIAQTYQYTPDASVLLITNNRISQDQYKAWRKLFTDIGIKADIWDLSYYKGLNLAKDLGNPKSGKSLLKNYSGRTIILLNSEHPENSPLIALDQAQFYEAALKENINLLIWGGDATNLRAQIASLQLAPTQVRMNTNGARDFLKRAESQGLDKVISEANGQAGTKRDFNRLQQIVRSNPQANLALALEPDSSGALIPVLREGLSMLSGSLLAVSGRSNDILNANQRDGNLRAILLSLSFASKLKVLEHLLTATQGNPQTYLPDLTSVILHDVVESLFLLHLKPGTARAVEQLNQFSQLQNRLLGSRPSTQVVQSLARISAAASTFVDAASNRALTAVWRPLLTTAQREQSFAASHDQQKAAFQEFFKQRAKALAGNYEPAFDAYKMFIRPSQARAINNREMRMIRPVSVRVK